MREKILKKSFFFIFISFLFLKEISAVVRFDNPQINSESKILYTVTHNAGGEESYRALFLTDAQKNQESQNLQNTKILTCFPEKMELLSGGSVLQIRNRYGTARYSVADETLSWINVEKNLPLQEKGLVPAAASSSGKWLCVLEKNGAASGRLILKNVFTLQQYILDEHADFDYGQIPVKWCPGREILLYGKDGAVYFCDPRAYEQNMQMSDRFRKIGAGNMNCVSWANSKYFIYIDGGLVYKISADELYTRALYSSVVGSGAVVGNLPLGFDPRKDRFWCNSLCDKLALIKSNSVISIYKIDGTSSRNFSASFSKPLDVFSPQTAIIKCEVFWSSGGSEILWIDSIDSSGGKKSFAYKISEDTAPYISSLGVFENAKSPSLSPDGKKIAFGAKNHLYIYEISSWNLVFDLADENPVSYVWDGDKTLFAGGSSTVRRLSFDDAGKIDGPYENGKILFLSSVKSAFWKPGTKNTVTAQSSSSDSVFYDYIPYRNIWLETARDDAAAFDLMKKAAENVQVSQNGKFRAYVGTTDCKLFENALYLRRLTGKGSTSPFFEESVRKNGEARHVALAFDALDSADGIPEILSVLNDYKIKATFFLNGEFIKRYPKETRQILACGHDCASMFFSAADFREKGYVINEEFVRRGLARNEDEFFAVTGSELSLLWHAPFYSADEKIKAFGEKSGYKYIDMSRLALDTTTLEKDRDHYLSASDLVEFYVENAEGGMIIPVSTGISKGTRNDFLYEKLGLLIGDLLEKGFDFSLARDLR